MDGYDICRYADMDMIVTNVSLVFLAASLSIHKSKGGWFYLHHYYYYILPLFSRDLLCSRWFTKHANIAGLIPPVPVF